MKVPKLVMKKIRDELKILQRCADEMYGQWNYTDDDQLVQGFNWTLNAKKHISENYRKHLRTYKEMKELLRAYDISL